MTPRREPDPACPHVWVMTTTHLSNFSRVARYDLLEKMKAGVRVVCERHEEILRIREGRMFFFAEEEARAAVREWLAARVEKLRKDLNEAEVAETEVRDDDGFTRSVAVYRDRRAEPQPALRVHEYD